jgi:hypothetical protein
MFFATAVTLNNLPESQRSLHTCIYALLEGKPHMDLKYVTALRQEANLNPSPAEAGLNSGPGATVMPLMWIARSMSLVNHG